MPSLNKQRLIIISLSIIGMFCYEKHRSKVEYNIKLELARNDLINQHLLPPSRTDTKYTNKTYSQVRQDVTVYNIFQGMKAGTFIEIGAYNGETFSNTLWLEHMHKWTGLLIEANPENCKNIDSLYRKSWRLCGCLSETLQYMEFTMQSTLGGITKHISKDHQQVINKKSKHTYVPCFKLLDILTTISMKRINYFSLDVEGGEMFILQLLKNDIVSQKLRVDVWTIEYREWNGKYINTTSSLQKLSKIREYFIEIGNYFEHSILGSARGDGFGLDVVFVSTQFWCQSYIKLPNNTICI